MDAAPIVEWETETYPSSRAVTTEHNLAGRVASVSGAPVTGSPTTYASSLSYAAQGAISSVMMGNGMTESTTFNTRFQPTQISAGSLLTLNYDYGSTTNNGNVVSHTITRGSQVWTQTFPQYLATGAAYDGANRLIGAAESVTGTGTPWSQTYGYDAYGNRAVTASSFSENLSAPISTSQYSATTNRIITQSTGTTMPTDAYDAAGNLADHPYVGQFTYL